MSGPVDGERVEHGVAEAALDPVVLGHDDQAGGLVARHAASPRRWA